MIEKKVAVRDLPQREREFLAELQQAVANEFYEIYGDLCRRHVSIQEQRRRLQETATSMTWKHYPN